MQHHPGELKLAFEEFIKEDNAFGRVCTRMDRPVNVELILEDQARLSWLTLEQKS